MTMTLLATERARAERVYRYIVQYKRDHDGNSPSYRQIMDACDVSSTSQVSLTIDLLRRQGRIRLLENGTARSIAVVGGKWNMIPAAA